MARNRFILDENIIICAQTGKNERGEDDPAALDLLTHILEHGHRLAYTFEVWAKYSSQLKRLSSVSGVMQGTGTSVMRLLRDILVDDERNPQLEQAAPKLQELDRLMGVDEGDRVFVELAASIDANVCLVTTDRPLIEALANIRLPERYGFVVDRPEVSISRAGPQQ